MSRPRKIDRRVLARLDAAMIARTSSEEYSQAARMADACAESAKSNPSRNAFEALAALARREANTVQREEAERQASIAASMHNGTEPA